MQFQTLKAGHLQTICWQDNSIVDWAGGSTYSLDGKVKSLGYYCPFSFDSAICSADGTYAFIYQKLGTKGLLLKNGNLIREINRSYYCANIYELPAAFLIFEGKTYLVHCPIAYNRLDFEDVETGEIITNLKERKPGDRFHSRLEVNPDGSLLMSKGWVWHPLDEIGVNNIEDCFRNPLMLDEPQFYPNVGVEICTASFADNNTIVIGSSDEVIDNEKIEILAPKQICLWELKTDQLSKPISIIEDFGNLFAINDNYAWDLFGFPKIIDIKTGEIVEQCKEIDSGKQQSSIINTPGHFPSIIFNRLTKQIAIKATEKIYVLTPERRFR